eukprot:6924632-Karenia_brevis.AAC.1
MLIKSNGLQQSYLKVWYALQSTVKWRQGPIYKCAKAVERLGWAWVEPFCFKTGEGKTLNFMEMSAAAWKHEVREALRMLLWKTAAERRPDMLGIENGIDRVATLAMYRKRGLHDYDRGVLRSILAGAIRTQYLLWKAEL